MLGPRALPAERLARLGATRGVHHGLLGLAGAALVAASVAGVAAQGRPADADHVRARQRISMIEGALERAVSNGAQNMLRQVQTVMPDLPMLTGAPQVRGFHLEGYGVFFDVEVPALRTPITWTMRYMFDQRRAALAELVAELRRLDGATGSRNREPLEMLVRQLEASTRVDGSPPAAEVSDPNDAYTRAVKEALVDAMLENSGPLGLGTDEWLTVAARDNIPRDPLTPSDSADLNTVVFRVKGSELAAFRAGRLTLEEARTKVEVREQ